MPASLLAAYAATVSDRLAINHARTTCLTGNPHRPILCAMKRSCLLFLICAIAALINVRAETESIDLKALAKKARPAVMLLVVSDANGKEIATGTGFLVSSDGKLITNFHVIEKAASAVAKAENGGLFPVEGVLASDPKNDLVLLKLKAKELPFLTLGKSENIEVGTRIAIIGSPLGLEGTLSEGIVSAVRKLMGDMRWLQISAPVSPGSSGSPVLNPNGDVIGIASALLRGGQSLNFAVPVECATGLLAKAKPSDTPEPLTTSIVTDEEKIFTDPKLRAVFTALDGEKWAEMIKHAKVLVASYPNNAIAYGILGEAYGHLDLTDDEIASYLRAIKLKPDYADAWYNLGVTYEKSGRTADAITAYGRAIKIKPDYADAWNNLGAAFGKSGRYDDAISAYRQAVKIKPDYAKAWTGLGAAYGDSGRVEDQINACRQAIKLKPYEPDAWYNLGLAYGNSGHTDDAIAAWRQTIKIKPDEADAWFNLGVAYIEKKQYDEARKAVRQLEVLDPQKARKLTKALH